MAVNIGPKIGIDGEAEYRKELKGIIQETKTLAAESDAAAKAFQNESDNEEKAKGAAEKHSKAIEAQKKLISKLEEAVQKSAEATGENSQETLKWKEQLAKARSGLETLESQTRETTGGVKDLGDAEETTGGKTSVFGDVLKANLASKAIQKGLELTKKIAQEIAEFFVDAVKGAAEYADEISTLSKTTGLGTDTLQEYGYMAKLVDVDLGTITGALTKLKRNMDSARDGNASAKETFEKLGISITDVNGELWDGEDVFNDALAALREIKNPTERDAAAMDIFGKSATELNPLIETSAEDLEALKKEAHDAGAVLSKDTLDSLNEVQDGMDRMGLSWDALKKELSARVGKAIMPELEKALKIFREFQKTGDAGKLIEDLMSGISKAAKKIPELLRSMVTDKVPEIMRSLAVSVDRELPKLIKSLGTVLGRLLKNAPKIVGAGIELAGSLFKGVLSAIPEVIKGISDGFSGRTLSIAAQDAIDKFGEVRDALAEIPNSLDRVDYSLASITGKEKEAETWLAIIDKIQTKTHPAAGDTELLGSAVDRLKELYPELGDVIDAESGKWQINTDKIRDNISALSDRYRAEAYFTAASEILVDIAKVEREWEQVKAARDAALADRTAAENAAAQTYDLIMQLSDLQDAYNSGEIDAAALSAKLRELVPDVALNDVSDLAQYMTVLTEQWKQEKAAVWETDQVYQEANRVFLETDNKLKQLQSDASWFYAKGKSYIQRYAKEAAKTTPEAERAMRLHAKRIEDEFAAIPKAVEKAGYDSGVALGRGGARGIKASEGEMIASARSAMEKTINAMKRSAEISSPSKVTENLIGKNLGLGVIKGWNDVMDPAKLEKAFTLTPVFSAMTAGGTTNTTNNTTNLGGVSVNVYPAAGTNIDALTDEIMIKMQRAVNKRKAVFSNELHIQ